MIIDGEKFACEACVRGHRVSNCQHTNRPLQHINKKGRPVSQCAHCRSMRKSRTAHVKCDCGEKTSKCIHLQPPTDGHIETCCCNHGGRCTCAGKKEAPLDTVPESDSDVEAQKPSAVLPPKPIMRRRRANTIHSSDFGMSMDPHGHHKSSKLGRVSQKCGPYSLSRVNSATSATSLGSGTDSLLYQSNTDGHPLSRSFVAHKQRQVKSETASPLMSASSFAQLNSNLPPLDLTGISDYPSYVSNSSFDLFSGGLPSEEGPLLSAGLTRSVDWSHYDLRDTNGDTFTPSSYSQAGTQSFTGQLDFGSGSEALPHLAGTTSTSGDVSEVEDWLPGGEGELDGFGSSNFLRQGNAADLTSIDYTNFLKNEENSSMSHGFLDDDPAFFIPNYNGIAAVEESSESLGTPSLNNFWDM